LKEEGEERPGHDCPGRDTCDAVGGREGGGDGRGVEKKKLQY